MKGFYLKLWMNSPLNRLYNRKPKLFYWLMMGYSYKKELSYYDYSTESKTDFILL